MWWPWSLSSFKSPGRAATVARWMSCSRFVWFSDKRRLWRMCRASSHSKCRCNGYTATASRSLAKLSGVPSTCPMLAVLTMRPPGRRAPPLVRKRGLALPRPCLPACRRDTSLAPRERKSRPRQGNIKIGSKRGRSTPWHCRGKQRRSDMPMRGELSMPAGRFSVHVIKSPSLKGSPQALR